MNLNITLAIMAVEIALFVICYIQDRKPVNLAKPKLLPYKLIMMLLIVIFLATAAHVISLLTGQPVKPRSKMGI